jgi:FkbM family methyltransferase
MSERDPDDRRHSIFANQLLGSVKLWLLERWRASPLSWRVNLSVSGRFKGRRIRIPIIYGIGFQNVQVGELALMNAFSKVLASRPGPFVDVGVNLGQTLIKVKLIEPSRRYIGFEPNPYCCHYTTELIRINNFESCSLVPVGLADKDATVSLFAKSDAVDPSASIVDGFRSWERYRREQPVAVFRGDPLLHDLRELSILKIDVEGAELEVVAGLQETIGGLRPYVFCEILPVFDATTETGCFRQRRQDTLLAMLHALGYTLFRMLPDDSVVELRTIDVHGDLALCNYVFVPDAELQQFRQMFRVVTHPVAA